MFGMLLERILSHYFCNLKAMDVIKQLIEELPDYVNRCYTISIEMERDILILIDKMRDFREKLNEINEKYNTERLALNFDEILCHTINAELLLKHKHRDIINDIDDMASN